ncbi:MAG: hypothetical protein J07HX64_02393 [halophilic archaeon J07HX64]|jgi:hypothetical protein|nr:MAG: hypothetical protein J07HX64_02393 [halophilic archaeon J07HX64]
MAGQQPVSRRRALETLGAVVTAATAGVATAANSRLEMERSPETEEPLRAGELPGPDETVGTELTGLYTGTVDRVVDDEHVVILIETDERVIDQHVVPAGEYPSLEERDGVYLFILFGEVLAIWEMPDE